MCMEIGGVFHVYTMLLVIILWVIFRSETLHDALQYIGFMFGIGVEKLIDSVFIAYMKMHWMILAFAILLCIPVYQKILEYINKRNVLLERWTRSACCIIIMFLSLLQIVGNTYSPFIYFNF